MNRLANPVALALLLLVGCAHGRFPRPGAVTVESVHTPVLPGYRLACPDVLEVRFAEKPDWDCLSSIGTDGTLALGPSAMKVPVAGQTLEEAKSRIAELTQVRATTVQLQVVDPRSGRVELYGPQVNHHRSVSFRGPESVVELLLRTGALKPRCYDPSEVAVLRLNVAEGRAAELFSIDVEEILKGNPRTNVILQPGDQVYVGESRCSSFARLLPSRLKPTFSRLMGLTP